ncbi:hypothetical protein BU24DRAFT_362255 [Aaosphaeria arxii CBS 175.79]|uniref:6-phosphogluconate dehydrogenase C-terminal domain-like protein n=1 Tax=Aaosphaeria arxii CBS 175.79 TaxID=1450172 RepID=A0A6A5YA05_9PLEO|nr:uncharacterized protein BU24DRAFT_362255 [Aaosphaeria arxii CBS 175.79]KAF2021591.1 hypothetical protein BU24DRAFT_362255 [Aaosphaeria arxii CBS 175.79]
MGRVAFSQTSGQLRSFLPKDGKEPRTGQHNDADDDTVPDSPPVDSITPNLRTPNVADFYRAKPVSNRRIHILGLGSVGKLVAHSLRTIPNPPPVTLIFGGWAPLNQWKESKQTLQFVVDGSVDRQAGYDAELAFHRRRYHGQELPVHGNDGNSTDSTSWQNQEPQVQDGESTEPITSLIVCTSTPFVLQSLSAVRHRLRADSVILFLQDGMGTIEEVNREIFPDPATRPRYMVGVNTHGLHGIKDDPFTTVHAGFGTISLGLLPHEREGGSRPFSPTPKFVPRRHLPLNSKSMDEHENESSEARSSFLWASNDRYLLRTLLRAPALCATAFSPPDLLQMQLERLAISSVINPLSVLLDARNGAILYNYNITRTMRLLLAETSLVIRSLPQLAYIPNVAQRFDTGRLETLVVNTAHRRRDNISTMLADVRAGQITEIDYINGWIVRKGEELGLQCLTNYVMVNLVKGKSRLIQSEMGDDVPFVQERAGEGAFHIREGETEA